MLSTGAATVAHLGSLMQLIQLQTCAAASRLPLCSVTHLQRAPFTGAHARTGQACMLAAVSPSESADAGQHADTTRNHAQLQQRRRRPRRRSRKRRRRTRCARFAVSTACTAWGGRARRDPSSLALRWQLTCSPSLLGALHAHASSSCVLCAGHGLLTVRLRTRPSPAFWWQGQSVCQPSGPAYTRRPAWLRGSPLLQQGPRVSVCSRRASCSAAVLPEAPYSAVKDWQDGRRLVELGCKWAHECSSC